MSQTKYVVKFTTQFRKDYKLAIKRGLKMELVKQIVGLLVAGEMLPEKHKDHVFTGNWAGYWECHILPDCLLIYRIEDGVLVLTLTRTGSHSDLFGSKLINGEERATGFPWHAPLRWRVFANFL